MILDTDTCKFRRIINPYSAVFLRACASSISDLNKYLKGLSNLNNPKCLKVEVPYELRDEAQQFINSVKDRYNIVAVRITSKLNKSTILADMHSEDIELLHGFESGSAAMAQYVNSQDDNTLPAPKSKVMDFINKYLS